MPPISPVDIKLVLLTALFNPAVIVVALWMGATADQWQKVPLAAFAGAVAGSVVIYFAVRLGITGISGIGRAAAGVFIAQFLLGLVWATLGYQFRRSRP